MSLLNGWVERDFALVSVDTEGVDLTGRRGQVSKLVPIVHLNAVLAGRGAALVGHSLVAQIAMAQHLDDVLEQMPAAIESVIYGLQHGMALAKAPLYEFEGIEIALVGWSTSRQRLVGRVWTRRSFAEGFVVRDIDPEYVAVWDDSLEGTPEPRDVAGMVALSKAQAEFLRRTEPECAAGGALILAELGRDAMRIWKACDL